MHYLNVKINLKLVDKIDAQHFVVHSNDSGCEKSGRLGLDQVFRKTFNYLPK